MKRFTYGTQCLLILALSFVCTIVSAKPNVGEPVPTSGEYVEQVEDLRIKVLGGFLTVDRIWKDSKWQINRRWNPLQIVREPVANQVKYIERNGDRYIKPANNAKIFRFGKRRTIEITDTGYRWSDREGNWIDYDTNGRMTRYGDRNNVQVSVAYDSEGKLTSVFDHWGEQMLWYDYDEAAVLIRIRDYTDRKVEYSYTGDKLTTAKDVRGYDWLYGYSGELLTSKTDPEGREIKLTYNSQNRLVKVEDPLGVWREYLYDYDKSRREFLFRETDSVGKQTDNWYSREGELIREEIKGAVLQRISRDGNTRIVIDRNGLETRYEYDGWDNVLRIVYADGSSVSYEYEPSFTNVTRYTNENGVATNYEYDFRGNRTSMTEAVGTKAERVTEYTYDDHGNRLTVRRLGDAVTEETVTTYTYDNRSNVKTLKDPEGYITGYDYDVMGNVVVKHDARGNDWFNEYDPAGYRIVERDPLEAAVRYVYDKVGNFVKETNTKDHNVIIRYDSRNQPIERETIPGKPYRWEYDGEGRITIKTDEDDRHITRLRYDIEGRLVEVSESNNKLIRYNYTDANGLTHDLPTSIEFPTFSVKYSFSRRNRIQLFSLLRQSLPEVSVQYSYDSVGNITEVTRPNGIRYPFQYDKLNRIVVSKEDGGESLRYLYDSRDNLIQASYSKGISWNFFYDRNNYLVSKRRGQDQRQTYSYDETGNLIEKIGEDNVRLKLLRNEVGNAVQHMYFNKETDQLLEQLNFNYDDVGRLISWSDAYFSGNYLYDTNGRKILESINYGDFTKTISYEYFANGETKNIFYPSGLTIEHAYAASNVLSRIDISDKSNISFVGDIWSSDQKAIFPGGVVLNKEYTELFYPIKTELTGTNFGEDISMEFEYSPLGELVIRRYDDHEVMYGYDKWSRIITESNLEGARRDYNYDELGNRTEDSAVQDNLIYNEKSELVKAGELSFKYNLSGNLEEVKRNENILWKLQYDVEQRLANIRTDSDSLIAKYEYDPFGRRISKSTVSGIIYYFYSDSGLMAEFSESGEIKRLYGYKPNSTWGTSPLFFMENGKTYFQHADFLGLPFAVTDQSGTLVWRGFYDAYGREMSVVGDVIVPQRFMGQYKDEETGMYYNYHRYYDPSIGRYIQRDPLGFISGQNEYLYANANSQSYVDPQGLLYDQVAEIAAQAYAEAQAALVEVDAASIGRGVGSAAGRVASICSFAIGLPLAILLDPTECADDDVVEPDVSPDQERNTPPKPRPPLPPIPRPDRRTRYCNAICRADVDENLPNNCSIGGKWYAFGESFAKKCRDARNQAEKIAKEKLGADKVKHVQCKCTPRSGPTGPC